jgi:hypothetical protein
MGVLGGWAFSYERGTPVALCSEPSERASESGRESQRERDRLSPHLTCPASPQPDVDNPYTLLYLSAPRARGWEVESFPRIRKTHQEQKVQDSQDRAFTAGRSQNVIISSKALQDYMGTSLMRNASPQDSTVGLYLGPMPRDLWWS